MKFKGWLYDTIDWDSEFTVSEAIVTDERIAIDWLEDGVQYHLLAQSHDGGISYDGHYGTPRPDKNCTMRIERYTEPMVGSFCGVNGGTTTLVEKAAVSLTLHQRRISSRCVALARHTKDKSSSVHYLRRSVVPIKRI